LLGGYLTERPELAEGLLFLLAASSELFLIRQAYRLWACEISSPVVPQLSQLLDKVPNSFPPLEKDCNICLNNSHGHRSRVISADEIIRYQ
jgi:hypothetical protein